MATTSPARIDDDLYGSAKLVGEVQSRSASQQVVHWARIGRELEASLTVTAKEVAEVLAGGRSYDSLDAKEQALVRAEWSERMDERREALDLAAQFASRGRTWVELDDNGGVVERKKARRRTAVAEEAHVDKAPKPGSTTKRAKVSSGAKAKAVASAKPAARGARSSAAG